MCLQLDYPCFKRNYFLPAYKVSFAKAYFKALLSAGRMLGTFAMIYKSMSSHSVEAPSPRTWSDTQTRFLGINRKNWELRF